MTIRPFSAAVDIRTYNSFREVPTHIMFLITTFEKYRLQANLAKDVAKEDEASKSQSY